MLITNNKIMRYNGTSEDLRTSQEKSKDFKWEELNIMGKVQLEERHPVAYIPRDQDGSSTCVAQSIAKMLEIWDYKNDNTPTVYSATPIYQKRINKPGQGMVGADAFNITIKGNIYLEEDVKSQKVNDTFIDDFKLDISKKKAQRPTNFVILPVTFDAVVQELQKSGAVMVWNRSDYHEWCKKVPTGLSNNTSVGHSVCAVDAITYKGVEYIIVEDSWGTFENNSDIPLKEKQRAVTREYFDKHIVFCAAFTAFSFSEEVKKPKYRWSTYMKYGQTSPAIKAFQEVLKYEKFFPSNQECTGYWGGITSRAAIKWQVSHGLTGFQNETDMRNVQAGPKSLEILLELYS